MDYLYENLGHERFQEFCSNLISKEYPNIQVFPVGQPDGGRDTISYNLDSINKEFIVFQVKFVRNDEKERDVLKWLENIIDKEVQKIDKLILKGAKQYILLTNVSGTAHKEVGSKDKVNDLLEKKIKIPAICWWRDDISRLFEKDPLFKWSFPEIINGQDILNSILFENIQENKERRENVIRAYLIDQYEIDDEVKFKQIDLQNKLFKLFTDVPIRVKKLNEKDRKLKNVLNTIDFQSKQYISDIDYKIFETESIGAAAFLLNHKVQNEIERVLIEGGPGQGKSTISQFVCQVHRVRLLNKIEDINLLSSNFVNSPIRIPFKIDLRDIASWVERKNPYKAILSEEYFDSIWKNSLEAFIVGHIFYHSKLEEFTSTDFIAICKLSSVLFVFDGFDEIANLEVRSDVIEFINKGITRISANTKSLQVVITSRPAAFTDSVGFSIDKYPHFKLIDITANIINEYVEKWIAASKINSREASDLKKLIEEKLQLQHLKDLTKSPMQLAIFIRLLKTKGNALPNKRTTLYDNYIEYFFDRESEKNELIVRHREIIIEIHKYLAWVLHSEAELYKNSGSISISNLHLRVKDYLEQKGKDSSIAEQLFNVMKERVCALVSRVQGTFEFEVQPLREYFCAKYLYESAPHSSAGSIKKGTKPDRIRAILRNYYWQNVVRFFAGCVDAGELDMLIEELTDLQNDKYLKFTDYPRIITSQILSDYVFTQRPLKLKKVVNLIIDGINIRRIINQDQNIETGNDPLFLPIECGREEIVQECFRQLSGFPNNDYADELIGILKNNPFNNLETWVEYSNKIKEQDLNKWFIYAYSLEILYKLDDIQLSRFIKYEDKKGLLDRLRLVMFGNRFDIIENNKDYKNEMLLGILENKISIFTRESKNNSLNALSALLYPQASVLIFNMSEEKMSYENLLKRYLYRGLRFNNDKSIFDFDKNDEIDIKIFDYLESIKDLVKLKLADFRNNLEPWNTIVENGRIYFSDSWDFKIIANIAAAVKTKDVVNDFSDLSDDSVSLCKRVRYARLKSGNYSYWEALLSKKYDTKSILLTLFTWGTPKILIELSSLIDKKIILLDYEDKSKLARAISYTGRVSKFNKGQQKYIEDSLKDIKNSDEFKYFLSFRFTGVSSMRFIYENIKREDGILKNTIENKFEYLLNQYFINTSDEKVLNNLKKVYKKVIEYNTKNYYSFSNNEKITIDYSIAKNIMKDPKNYPKIVSVIAERSCRLVANQNLIPIGEIASNESWFEND